MICHSCQGILTSIEDFRMTKAGESASKPDTESPFFALFRWFGKPFLYFTLEL